MNHFTAVHRRLSIEPIAIAFRAAPVFATEAVQVAHRIACSVAHFEVGNDKLVFTAVHNSHTNKSFMRI